MRRGGELRGNVHDRKARKNWLMSPASGFELVWYYCGVFVLCFYCRFPLDYEALHVDRIVPGSKGGRYTHVNIRPACFTCNTARSDNEDWTP